MDHPAGTDLVAPAGPGYQRAPRVGNWLQVIGRLAPGATMGEAQQEADGIARRFAETYADRERGLAVRLTTLQEFETREMRVPVLLLLGAALIVYLVVCVNVSGLLLVRALSRDHEAMVRASLGASRWAMVRLILHETSLIALAAVPGAWMVATLAVQVLVVSVGPDYARLADAAIGLSTAVAGACLLVLSTLLLAIWPAWHMAARAPGPGMASRSTTEASGRRHVRRVLVAAQVACSTLLIVMALLLSVSLRQMLERPRGFDAEEVITIRYDLDWEQPKARIDDVARRVLESVEQEPGVAAAGIADRFPLQGGTQSTRVRVFGEASVPADRPDVSVRSATPGYFAALRIPLLAGRTYADGLTPAAHREVVVNTAFAMRYFGTTDVLGRQISVDWEVGEVRWVEIVGVTGDIRQGVRDQAPVPEVYRPWSQAFWPLLHVAVRGDGRADLAARLRTRLQRDVPDQPIALLAPLDDVVALGTREPAMLARVVSTCSVAAALLAMLGLYGLIAGEVLARRREVGIRLALGARTWPLRGWLLRPALLLTLAGILVGLVASVPAARVVEAQLFDVGTDSPAVRIGAAMVVLSAGLLAAVIPAWRVVGAPAFAALRDP
jgi:putative ABC transport system permease protein